MKLFQQDMVVGIFRGFSAGGLEFHAEIVLPYKNDFQRIPMHGQFLVVQLEHENEAVLGRITSIQSEGRLVSSAGEEYGIRTISEERSIPEELREQYLKYKVNIRVLGVLRLVNNEVVFVTSHRRLPHVGSKVAFLSKEVLENVAGHNIQDGASLGHLALGEFIFAAGDENFRPEPWMQIKNPLIIPKFHVQSLVARRTFVFARAGFGKSNLVKLLFSMLYRNTPVIEKRGGRKVPVGTIIFDPDGEYFWPDDKNRPGLCDVPELENKVVVFTPKKAPSEFYQSFVASDIKLDIRSLRPSVVISIALAPEKQDQQNVRKLKSLNDYDWSKLVDLIYLDGNSASLEEIRALLKLEKNQEAEMQAARANMTTIVKMLHDPKSQMLNMLHSALSKGHICVIDVSQMRGTPALILSGLILQYYFDHNQEEFTKSEPKTIPIIAVLEEAQSVLGSTGSSGEGPYVAWVKEGRKYDLGTVLITQQPGSISKEILSQGDNWFVFHLLSAHDLYALKDANAHFSDDILSSLLNEPIPGHCVFWSSVGGKSYPLSLRILSFENLVQPRDPKYNQPAIATAASLIKELFAQSLDEASQTVDAQTQATPSSFDDKPTHDSLQTYKKAAISKLQTDLSFRKKIETGWVSWGAVKERLKGYLPNEDIMPDKDSVSYYLVKEAMNTIYGEEGKNWKTEKRSSSADPEKKKTYLTVIKKTEEGST